MKIIFFTIILLFSFSLKAQISPILDHTWTIEQIDTGTQIISADLNAFGFYDTFQLIYTGTLENIDLYFMSFGHCIGDLLFDDTMSTFNYNFSGCTLNNDDSSQIAIYFNEIFIQQNTAINTIDSDNFPNLYGPLSYNFTTSGDFIYLHITNTIGEVATFYTNNLSQEEFLKENISVYPNPVVEVLNIKSSGIAIDIVKIYDLSGRLINELNTNTIQIDVSQLQKGMYILNIETSVGVLREKMVKK